MQLTRFSDYSLRVLMYLALKPGNLGHTAEIARSFNISHNHLIKIVNHLVKLGYIVSKRGKTGGLELGQAPDLINIGTVVRHTEQTLEVINCEHPFCPFAHSCQLKSVLNEATRGFLQVLDNYTLTDIIANEKQLNRLLS